MVAVRETVSFQVGDRVRGGWKAARNKFGKVVHLYQKKSEQWAEVEWEDGNSSKLRIDQISPAEGGNLEAPESAEPVEPVATEGGNLQPGDRVKILYCEGDDSHNQQWCDRIGTINRLHPYRADNQVQVDFFDQDKEQHWAFDYALVELVERPEPIPQFQVGDRVRNPQGSIYGGEMIGTVTGIEDRRGQLLPVITWDGNSKAVTFNYPKKLEILDAQAGSETVSEVEPLPILEAIATTEDGATALATAVAGGSIFLDLAQRINTLDSQGQEAEQTALNATKAALDLRRELGQWLSEAKTQIEAQGYGQWSKWLTTNCPSIHPRMASTYMRISREWDFIQEQAGDEPLTLRRAIAILQARALPQSAEVEDEPLPILEAIATTPVSEVEKRVSEVVTDPEDLDEGKAIAIGDQHGTFSGGESTETLDSSELGQGNQPTSQPHPAGVLASSARNKTDEFAEKDERYTPDYVWKACLKVAGTKRFDLDPATNDSLRPIVPCTRAYTKLDDGLSQDWSAESLWLNPPYSRMEEFTSKYLATWENSRFTHGFLLAKGDFSTKWAQRLLKTCTAVVLIDHRLTFLAPGRELETSFFASMLFYHGPAVGAAAKLSELGTVLTAMGVTE